MNKSKIMIIEDDFTIQTQLKNLLVGNGYEVEAVIIFVTSSNTDMDELNSIMLGGDAFITKPYNTAILLAKIAALLRKAYAPEQKKCLYGMVQLCIWKATLLSTKGTE